MVAKAGMQIDSYAHLESSTCEGMNFVDARLLFDSVDFGKAQAHSDFSGLRQ